MHDRAYSLPYISIHEVAKTSTRRRGHCVRSLRYFNPRGRKGLDLSLYIRWKTDRYFNPRGRKDLDLRLVTWLAHWQYFNPRGRKDLDAEQAEKLPKDFISIHEVAKTSTESRWGWEWGQDISIHEVAKTSTPCSPYFPHWPYISIHEVAKTST